MREGKGEVGRVKEIETEEQVKDETDSTVNRETERQTDSSKYVF